MDTDYLTPMAYECILCANDATDVLKSELGAMCSEFGTEDEYLNGILGYVKKVGKDIEGYLDYWNLLDQTDIKVFIKKIKILKRHIEKTLTTPIKERGTPEW